MSKHMYTVDSKRSDKLIGNFKSKRNFVADSLRNFRSQKFHHKTEERGGSKNETRSLLEDEDNFFDFEECDENDF